MKRKRYNDDFRASAVLMLEAAGYTGGDSCVYGIFEKGQANPFYIGTTKHDPQDRFKSHMYLVRKGDHSNNHFANKVKKIGFDNVELIPLAYVSEEDRFEAERLVIETVADKNIPLTNLVYNGYNFEISDSKYDIMHHPGLTPDLLKKIVARKSPMSHPDPLWNRLLSLSWNHVLFCIKEIIHRYPNEVKSDYPGLTDWYYQYVALNGEPDG